MRKQLVVHISFQIKGTELWACAKIVSCKVCMSMSIHTKKTILTCAKFFKSRKGIYKIDHTFPLHLIILPICKDVWRVQKESKKSCDL